MITATCTSSDCKQNGLDYNFRGQPSRVECGACGADCDLTDLRDDQARPEPTE